jgi:two-component sensor histidine kinase
MFSFDLKCFQTLKRYFFWNALIVISTNAKAQSYDTTIFYNFYSEGKRQFSINTDSTQFYFEKARQFADSLHYINGQIAIYRGLSGLAAHQGNVAASLGWIEKGIDLVEKNNLSDIVKMDFLINQGVALQNAGQPGNALEGYMEAEEIARKFGLPEKRALLLNNIGVLYRQLGRYEESVDIYHRSLALRAEAKDSMGMANNYFNLAAVYSRMGAYDSVMNVLEKAKELYVALESESDILLIELSKGETLYKLGSEGEAMATLLPLSKKTELPFQLKDYAVLYLTMSDYYLKRKELAAADQVLNIIGSDIEKSQLVDFKLKYFNNQAIVAEEVGRYRDAVKYLKAHKELLAEVAQEESQTLRREMETKYLTHEKEYQLQLQALEIQKKDKQRQIFALGLLLLAACSAMLFRIAQIRKRTNGLLAQKNLVISKALNEKDILLREIHHRVKNNLQFISSLLGLQSEHIADKTALDALQEGQDRVQSMALIHQNLYQEENLTGVEVRDYFVKLIRNLFDSYNVRKDQISLSLDIANLNLDVDSVIPIGLIVNELVSNSLKYAFPGDRKGSIRVSLVEEGAELVLEVGDDGIGMPKSVKSTLGSSFGYRLIHVFKEQLAAKLSVNSDIGTLVTLRIGKYLKVI